MAKKKASSKSTIFIAVGPSNWLDGYGAGTGPTKKDAVQRFYDNDGHYVSQILEVTLPKLEDSVSKIPVTKVTVNG